jgi:GntR family transcriptional regulator
LLGANDVPDSGALPLDRSSPVPLWAQLEAELRRRLTSGEFPFRFPTDRELVDTYKVSRHTARDAVDRLCSDGLLERRRGRGTFVRQEYERPAGAVFSLFRAVEAEGSKQTIEVRALVECTDPAAAARLDLDSSAPLVLIDRLRRADGEPLVIDKVWLPADVARPLLTADLTEGVIYNKLASLCGIIVASGWERIRPTIPRPDERETLRMPEGTAVFTIERMGRSADRAVEWRVSKVRGDRYSFVTNWDPRTGVDRIPIWQRRRAGS